MQRLRWLCTSIYPVAVWVGLALSAGGYFEHQFGPQDRVTTASRVSGEVVFVAPELPEQSSIEMTRQMGPMIQPAPARSTRHSRGNRLRDLIRSLKASYRL